MWFRRSNTPRASLTRIERSVAERLAMGLLDQNAPRVVCVFIRRLRTDWVVRRCPDQKPNLPIGVGDTRWTGAGR